MQLSHAVRAARARFDDPSLVSAGGLVYFLNDDGVTHVVKPSAEFQLVAKNELGEKCFASPAISEGRIFIRSDKHLFCIAQPRR